MWLSTAERNERLHAGDTRNVTSSVERHQRVITRAKLLRSLSWLFLLAISSGPADASITSKVEICISKEIYEPVWETYLAVSPEDVSTAACLLDFYANRLRFVPDLMSRKVRLIRWVIENHPDISLAGFLERDLRIAAADPSVVTEIRSVWLAQIRHYADNWRVLLNAGNSMGLADPELAAQWLWQGRKLQTDNCELADALGYIYANAIAGS